jgi:hypothetical protein
MILVEKKVLTEKRNYQNMGIQLNSQENFRSNKGSSHKRIPKNSNKKIEKGAKLPRLKADYRNPEYTIQFTKQIIGVKASKFGSNKIPRTVTKRINWLQIREEIINNSITDSGPVKKKAEID